MLKKEKIMDTGFLNDFYKVRNEDERLTKSKGINVEFVTTMHYIEKYLKPNSKILELGASTGAYSVPLAKQGHEVVAVELLDCNLDVLKNKAKDMQNLTPIKANALDLSQFEDNSFDMVLSLGPMYHLYTKKDDIKAINEAIRVCKKGSIIIFAYITPSSTIFYEGVVKNGFDKINSFIDKKGHIKNIPERIFSTHFPDEFEKYFENKNVKKLHQVAAEGVANLCREAMDKLNQQQYEMYLKWHLNTCERIDQLGISSHILYICKKV